MSSVTVSNAWRQYLIFSVDTDHNLLCFFLRYNGFCKGVLWPVLHNVTSVYSARPDGGGLKGNSNESFLNPSNSTSGDTR